ncbi:MAG: hypothetical protein HZB41_08930 [Ignavibacteriae bacterium]|nr:hypothetical protein [Ignavibacteriota bacterium]
MSVPQKIILNKIKLASNQIESTDRQIDKLVYELYALTEEEIKVVEGVGK